MSKQVSYVGVDVGCTELWAALEGFKPRSFKHTTSGIRALYTWARKKSGDWSLCFCMEATGVYSVSVARRLVNLPDSIVCIVNPMQIAAFAKVQLRRCKTDQIDAEVIRAFAETQKPKAWSPDPKPLRQLYQLVSQADAVRQSLTQWNNRHHAQKFIADLPDAVKKSQRNIERSLTRQLEQIEKAIADMCAADADLAQKIALLCTIPGIAKTSAVRLIAYGRTWLTERKRGELVAHAGLAPHHKQSGTSVKGKSRIDKHGDRRLRKTLYMPALVGAHHNPNLKQFYQRLLTAGKPKMVALVACMKKLLLIVRAILITKKPFDAQYQPLT
jgi:transposase